jgi:hypothetical protein
MFTTVLQAEHVHSSELIQRESSCQEWNKI